MSKHIERLNLAGNPNPGLFCVTNDDFCISYGLKRSEKKELKEVLDIKIKEVKVAGTAFLGIFTAMNSKGIILPYTAEKREIESFEKLGLNVFKSSTKETALGNLVLVNDNGCLISRDLEEHKDEIEKCFGVPVEVGKIAGLDVVGACAVVTNEGLLVHIDAKDEEIEQLEKLFGVEAGIGTVNFGSPYVASGIIANSNGFITSKMTTGPELHRIDEALGFI